jgi:very-short-patch-repair endonuclease
LVLEPTRFGIISKRQLLQSGLSRHAIEWRVRSGWLLPICDGVYSMGRPATRELAVWKAALLAAGPRAALFGRTAGAAWGLLNWHGPVELIRPHSRKPSGFRIGPPGLAHSRGVKVHRSDLSDPGDVVQIHGLRTTSVARTLVDLAGSLKETRLRAAFNEADRRGLLNEADLESWTKRSAGRNGAARFRRLVQTRLKEVELSDSELEAMFLHICAMAGIQMPEPNQRVLTYRVDCLWREQALVVELDSYEFHRGPMAGSNDSRRENDLRRAGYAVLRFRHDELKNNRDQVASLVSQELAVRTPARSGAGSGT